MREAVRALDARLQDPALDAATARELHECAAELEAHIQVTQPRST